MIANSGHLLDLTRQHLQLSLIAVLLALIVGGAAGVLMTRYPRLVAPIQRLVGIFQTIPALAFIGFVMLFLGLTRATGITVLFFYCLMPIVHSTYTGITGVESGVVEAARGMGMTRRQILWSVELPLALPVILVGVRIATVIAVGTAAVMSLAGAGGLGQEIFAGIDRVQTTMILAGALPAALLGVLADVTIGTLERMVTPRGITGGKAPPRGVVLRRRVLVIGAAAVVLAALVTGIDAGPRLGVVRIGSKDFSENMLLGEMVAQLIEGNTNIQVVRKLSLGGTTVCFDGLRSGSIDLYPEYDGTAYTIHLGHTERIRDPARVYSAVKQEFEQRFRMTWSAPFGFNNYFALAMPQPLAQQYGIRTVSQLAPLSNRFVFGTTNEFMGRPLDGYVPLAATYGLQFRAVRTMMTGLRYNAIQAND
ncbi:MAG: transporter permease subunit, partial [Firmicutes bacterium]|nr:transporter permease subunit [Bacillota bacterium]